MNKNSSIQQSKRNGSILVIDSGMGGVSVLKALINRIPGESFIYFADYAFLPYGEKTPQAINDRCHSIIEYYKNHNIKAVVLACNSATAAAIAGLRKNYSFLFFGTEPGIKPASKNSQVGIAVLATALTLQSQQFDSLVQQYGSNVPVYAQAAPELVSLVESGEWFSDASENIVRDVLEKLPKPFDTLLLGCTHFCFLKKQIQTTLESDNKNTRLDHNPKVEIIDTSNAIAKHVVNQLSDLGLLEDVIKPVDKTCVEINYSKPLGLEQSQAKVKKYLKVLKASLIWEGQDDPKVFHAKSSAATNNQSIELSTCFSAITID